MTVLYVPERPRHTTTRHAREPRDLSYLGGGGGGVERDSGNNTQILSALLLTINVQNKIKYKFNAKIH